MSLIVNSFRVVSGDPAQTGRIAAVVATRLMAGDALLLQGDLAAGKTTFVKAVVAALGSIDLVTSPTFALAQFYTSPVAPIVHVDTYRLSDLAEYRDLGLEDYVAASISLVEWGEKIAEDFPCHLTVDFHQEPGSAQTRSLQFSSFCPRWTDELEELQHEVERVTR